MSIKEPSNLGELLVSERTRANLSIADVANKLHLTVNLIEKIEDNRFDATNLAPVFLRGYIRSYAKLVGISETIINQAFAHAGLDKAAQAESIQTTQRSQTINTHAQSKTKIINITLYCFIVIILIFLASYWHKHTNVSKTTTNEAKAIKTQRLQLSKATPATPPPASNATIAAALPEQGIPNNLNKRG